MLSGIYNTLMLPASLVAYPLFLTRERGRRRLVERYGSWNLPEGEYLWLHGASAGEVRGVLSLARELRERLGGRTLVTATSITGLDAATELFDERRLIPFDSMRWYEKAFREVKIRAFIGSETELWPSLSAFLHSKSVPQFLVNARISDYSYPRYRLVKRLLRPVLAGFDAIYTGDSVSAERFVDLGAPQERVHFLGNAKYDSEPSPGSAERIAALRSRFWKSDAPTLVLGSLRPGEEEPWFKGIKEALDRGAALHVVVAPRHKEKFEYFGRRLAESGIPYRRWSSMKASGDSPPETPAVLLDTFGDLVDAYGSADLAFIGATLVNVGGHNPLEASMHGVAVAFGPHVHVVRDIVADLEARDAGMRVEGAEGARAALDLLLSDRDRLRRMGERGREAWRSHRGAAARIAERIVEELGNGRGGGPPEEHG